jgi:hypothetical protein
MRILVAVLAIAVSMPVISIPTSPEAQTMGRNNMRQARPRVSREDRLLNLRYEAEDRLLAIETRIAEIEGAAQGGAALTAGQQRELAQLNDRKAREQREIERLTAALES